ncbi:uncharacterized protein DUF4229 [Motilibacter peucedani]|uniref:Uncharacterized protein DUF4229 n=1 Tax=Motilibacter peucedani TaxID=598650 RepID=A0A420XKI0_9ACTN|nr:DUF4229 domain-containing protein [Motilibacter peucedani]RKS69171.1 uncharacterized protein DUF4229 [Motilibacter peucedani]
MQQRFALLRFLTLRTLLLVAVAVVLWAVGLRGAPALLLALLISSVVSVFVLSSSRDAVSASLEGRVSRMRHRIDEAASSEDE